jgi:HlyD family secretion protein
MSVTVTTPIAYSPRLPLSDRVPPTPLPRFRGLVFAGATVMTVFLGGFGGWSAFAPLQSAAMAPGVVAVETYRKTIQHLEGGIIAKILVKDGDYVTEGQPLVRLDDTKARTVHAAVEGQLWDAYARQARLIAERDGLDAMAIPERLLKQAQTDATVEQVLMGQRAIFDARRTLLLSKIAAIRQRIQQANEEIRGLRAQDAAAQNKLAIIHEELSGVQQLFDKGLERKSRLLQLQREQEDITGNRGQFAARIAQAQATISESEVNILTLKSDSANEVVQQLRDTEEKVHGFEEQLQAASDVLDRVEVRAPEAGIVTDLRVHTPGGVVKPGDALLDLVPQADKMIIQAHVRPEDMDLVRPGLPALVQLLAYKQRRTPPLDGKVIYLSPDRLTDEHTAAGMLPGQPYFLAKIALDEDAIARLPDVGLVPGMPAEAMIKTGRTTVALYALAPILDSFHKAFREK